MKTQNVNALRWDEMPPLPALTARDRGKVALPEEKRLGRKPKYVPKYVPEAKNRKSMSVRQLNACMPRTHGSQEAPQT